MDGLVVDELIEEALAVDDGQLRADLVARRCAELAGYGAALLTLAVPEGALVGTFGLSEDEQEHFRRSAARASMAERTSNRAAILARAFPGTGIAYVPRAVGRFNVVSTPSERERPDGGWHPDDALYVAARGTGGRVMGLLSLDAPLDGQAPSAERLDALQEVERLLARVTPALEADLLWVALEARDARLGRAERFETLGGVACEVAHDFNNVLTAVLGFTSMAAHIGVPAEAERLLGGIVASCERGASLSHKLLAVGRGAGLDDDLLELGPAVRSLQSMLEALLPEGIELAFELDPDPLYVRIPALHVTQIVTNLAVNAKDAMPEGGRLCFRTSAFVEQATRFVRLTVADTGQGMDEDTRGRASEAFFTTKEKGTGLGLATVRRLVTSAGGRLAIDSVPGLGASMHVDLPRADPEH